MVCDSDTTPGLALGRKQQAERRDRSLYFKRDSAIIVRRQ